MNSDAHLARRLAGYAARYREYVAALEASPCRDGEGQGIAHFRQIAMDLEAAAAKLALGERIPA